MLLHILTPNFAKELLKKSSGNNLTENVSSLNLDKYYKYFVKIMLLNNSIINDFSFETSLNLFKIVV